MLWYLIIGITIIVMMVMGVVMYKCYRKDKKTHPMSGLLTFAIPVFGQLASRMFIVSSGKGLAQMWLLFPLLLIPPFSAIPAWYVYNDMAIC